MWSNKEIPILKRSQILHSLLLTLPLLLNSFLSLWYNAVSVIYIFVLPLQAKKARDRVYDSSIPIDMASWRLSMESNVCFQVLNYFSVGCV